MLKQIVISIISSSVVAGFFLYIMKQYFGKWISNEFDKRSKLFGKEIESARRVDSKVIDTELGLYPEIVELIYRLTVIIRNGLDQTHAHKWSGELQPLGGHLTDLLFRQRFFLQGDLFDDLHEYKHIVQDAVLMIDTQLRDEHMFDAESYKQAIERFRPNADRAIKLEKKIISTIEQKVAKLRQP